MPLTAQLVSDEGLIYALDAPQEILAPTIQPNSQVAWDATGDGNEELMAFDSISGKMVVMETKAYDASGDLGLQVGILRTFSSGLGDFGTVFSTDVNADGEHDLVLLSDNNVRIWNGGDIRPENVEQPPDSEFQFPENDLGPRVWLEPSDLSGDESPEFVFGYYHRSEAGILTGFDEEEPRIIELTADFDRAEDGFNKPQLVKNWDGAGQNVVALEADGGTTIVYSFDTELNATKIDEVPVRGLFAQVRNGGLPEMVVPGFLTSLFVNPIATVYQKIGEEWVPEELEEPSEPIDFGLSNYTAAVIGKVAEGSSGREGVYFTRPGGSGVYYRIIPSVESEAPRLIVQQGNATFPPGGFHALRLPNRSEEILAIHSYRTLRFDFAGNYVGNIMLSLRRQNGSILEDIYSLVGNVGQSAYAHVDSDSTPDLVSLRRGDTGVSVFYQAGNPALSETVTYPANASTPAERLVKGNFSGTGSAEFAISGGLEASGIPVYRLTPEAFLQTGGALPSQALGSGDFTGDGSDELLFLQDLEGTLRYASFDDSGAHSGGDVIALAGRTIASGSSLAGSAVDEEFIQPRQVLVVDADGDGDDDILTFPSALGQRIALHRSYGGNFSLEPLSGLLESNIFGLLPEEDGVSVGVPSHLLSGNFLQGGGRSLVTYGGGTDIFGSPTSSLTSWSGSLDNPVALASSPIPILASIAVADLDGDGLDDIIASGGRTTDIFGNAVLDSSIVLLRSKGDGTFEDAVSLADPRVLISQILVDDVNLDGVPDVTAVIEENNSIVFYRGRRVSAYPSFAEWAAEHSPSMPGQLDRPDGDEPNLVLFARGEIPSASSGVRPPAPPVNPSASWDGGTLNASHPIPRLGNEDTVNVTLQYSYDLVEWTDADEERAFYSQDPATPQWLIKHYPSVYGSEKFFHRFRVDYITR